MDTPRRQPEISPRSTDDTAGPISHGESAAIKDLTHRDGMLRVDRLTSTVRVQRHDGYHATCDLDTGQLLAATRNIATLPSPSYTVSSSAIRK